MIKAGKFIFFTFPINAIVFVMVIIAAMLIGSSLGQTRQAPQAVAFETTGGVTMPYPNPSDATSKLLYTLTWSTTANTCSMTWSGQTSQFRQGKDIWSYHFDPQSKTVNGACTPEIIASWLDELKASFRKLFGNRYDHVFDDMIAKIGGG